MTNQEIVYIIVACVLLVCAITDWYSYEIWIPVVLCPVPVMLYLLKLGGEEIWKNTFVGVVITGVFLLVGFVTRGQIGKGDCFLLGLISIGMEWWQIMSVLFIIFSLASIFGILLVLVRKKSRKYKIPFAPFIMAAYVLTIGSHYL